MYIKISLAPTDFVFFNMTDAETVVLLSKRIFPTTNETIMSNVVYISIGISVPIVFGVMILFVFIILLAICKRSKRLQSYDPTEYLQPISSIM